MFRVLRALFVAAPPLLLAGALFAAPKAGKAPAKPVGKAPVTKVKDGGVSASDAGLEVATSPPVGAASNGVGKEAKPDAGPKAKGEGGELVKESEKKEGDASVKVFEFGTTEIEGRTRWPAVTYFVRRMRAEFEAQKLPHRPFLLEITKGDPAVK